MAETSKIRPWLVRIHHRFRSTSFAMLFGAVCLHSLGREYSPGTWLALISILLIYPQALYPLTCRAADPIKREIMNLRIDSILLGIFVAATEFPLWLSFSAILGTLTNNTANKGWRGVPETLLAVCAGASLWVALFGLKLSLHTDLLLTLYIIVCLSWYLLSVDNTGFVRNVQLRQTREALKAREQDLVAANEMLEDKLGKIAELQQQLSDQANHDPLTGLYNRRYLGSTLDRDLARCKRDGLPISLIMIDIDHFKQINDTYGHQAGDEVLTQLGATLGAMARAGDVACRYGGEEFLLLMPTMTLNTAQERAEELRANFAAMVIAFGEFRIETTLSIGIAVYPGHGTSSDDLIRNADRALYRAKHHGRNRVEVAHFVGDK